ncbi:hypothetical protein [Sphingobium lignivorans]|uniref:DUF4189 domain-containing protein n=1 Tax=Sphingobium lignivorans TaxID=2735886 RepID=A0ABR6NFP2_9SPHN|nr:hypothetical protein [Sphingobium lignivorans]MBB5985328.1 hypothetical protein [Sphingobium lignivorans]
MTAEVCRYCGATFTPEEIAAERKSQSLVVGIGCLGLLLALGYCAYSVGDTGSQSQNAATPAAATQAAAPAKPASVTQAADIKRIALPKGAPAAPVTPMCAGANEAICEANRIQFDRQDWPRAWRGDYQGQRNVAYCLSTGCDGAVTINESAACAWRIVILAAAHDEATDLDNRALEANCDKLSEIARTAATIRAEEIATRIYPPD